MNSKPRNMNVERRVIFTLMLFAIFSISSVCSGHSGHGHSSHGHSSHGHSSHGHSSHGSHHTDGHSSSHVESSGQSHHDSQTHLGGSQDHHDSQTIIESQYHHNSDSSFNGNDNSDAYGHDYNPHSHHHGYYPHHIHHNNQDNFAHNGESIDETPTTSTTTTPAPKIEETWLQVSCDKGLSDLVGNNYPRESIAAAVRQLKDVSSSSSRNSGQRKTIKMEVLEYFIMQNMPNFETRFDKSTDCEEIISYIAPLGGCDIRYTGFIIVNVPDLTQVIKTTNCRSTFTLCNYEGGSICLQSKKEQKLLVLPAKRGPFNVSDFSVATFKIHDGCQCLSGDQNNVMDYFINP